MLQYRLLRDNRETGPYSLDDLIALPLKAYDLIWVDGKSAAWKYPSEYEELKAYAPPATDDLYHPLPATATVETPRKNVEKSPQKRFVSVILPGGAATDKKTITPAHEMPAFSESVAVAHNGWQVEEKLHIDWPRSRQQRSYKPYAAGAVVLLLLAGGIYFLGKPRTAERSSVEDNHAAGNLASYAASTSTPGNTIMVTPLEFAVLKKDITVQTNDYGTGVFGGITDLQITVGNSGNTVLRDVVLQIDYLANDKAFVDAETLHIPYLPAGASRLVQVPSTDKGVAVQTRIISVNGFRSTEPVH